MQDEVFGFFYTYSYFWKKKYGSDEIEPSKDYAFVGQSELSFYCWIW